MPSDDKSLPTPMHARERFAGTGSRRYGYGRDPAVAADWDALPNSELFRDHHGLAVVLEADQTAVVLSTLPESDR